jgi:hypothetical protein
LAVRLAAGRDDDGICFDDEIFSSDDEFFVIFRCGTFVVLSFDIRDVSSENDLSFFLFENFVESAD